MTLWQVTEEKVTFPESPECYFWQYLSSTSFSTLASSLSTTIRLSKMLVNPSFWLQSRIRQQQQLKALHRSFNIQPGNMQTLHILPTLYALPSRASRCAAANPHTLSMHGRTHARATRLKFTQVAVAGVACARVCVRVVSMRRLPSSRHKPSPPPSEPVFGENTISTCVSVCCTSLLQKLWDPPPAFRLRPAYAPFAAAHYHRHPSK